MQFFCCLTGDQDEAVGRDQSPLPLHLLLHRWVPSLCQTLVLILSRCESNYGFIHLHRNIMFRLRHQTELDLCSYRCFANGFKSWMILPDVTVLHLFWVTACVQRGVCVCLCVSVCVCVCVCVIIFEQGCWAPLGESSVFRFADLNPVFVTENPWNAREC